jgi:Predicted transcriptional regulator with C-terminal CBS domains
MRNSSSAASLLSSARSQAGLSQRGLARRARTAQSVVARIELGETSPSLKTLEHLLRFAGFSLSATLERIRRVDRSVTSDIPRILAMTPEQRLREVAHLNRFVAAARRV